MAITRRLFEVRDPGEGYVEDDARNTDAPDVRGMYLQTDTSNDSTVVVSRDASNNLTLTDPNAGTKTLSSLSGVSYNEFLLDNEPTAETGFPDDDLAALRGKIVQGHYRHDLEESRVMARRKLF